MPDPDDPNNPYFALGQLQQQQRTLKERIAVIQSQLGIQSSAIPVRRKKSRSRLSVYRGSGPTGTKREVRVYSEPKKGRWAREIIEQRKDAHGKAVKYRRIDYEQFSKIPSLRYLSDPLHPSVDDFIKGIKDIPQEDGTWHSLEHVDPNLKGRQRMTGVFKKNPPKTDDTGHRYDAAVARLKKGLTGTG